jgi:hypothetical protein
MRFDHDYGQKFGLAETRPKAQRLLLAENHQSSPIFADHASIIAPLFAIVRRPIF